MAFLMVNPGKQVFLKRVGRFGESIRKILEKLLIFNCLATILCLVKTERSVKGSLNPLLLTVK